MEETLVLIKPDATRRRLENKIIEFITNKGFKIAKYYNTKASRSIIETHYIEHKDKPYFEKNVDFMTSGSIIVLLVQGLNVIEGMRLLQGTIKTPGTIRFMFSNDLTENTIHCSDSLESAEKEIKLWFDSPKN